MIRAIKIAGNSEERHALVQDNNGDWWSYILQYNNRTWKDEEDYLDNAYTDFKNEWRVLEERGLSIHSTELFEKQEADDFTN